MELSTKFRVRKLTIRTMLAYKRHFPMQRTCCRNFTSRPLHFHPSLTVPNCGLIKVGGSQALEHKNKMKKRQQRSKHCALAVVRWSQKKSPRRRPKKAGLQTNRNIQSTNL